LRSWWKKTRNCKDRWTNEKRNIWKTWKNYNQEIRIWEFWRKISTSIKWFLNSSKINYIWWYKKMINWIRLSVLILKITILGLSRNLREESETWFKKKKSICKLLNNFKESLKLIRLKLHKKTIINEKFINYVSQWLIKNSQFLYLIIQSAIDPLKYLI
jgi:hypothetical protein